MSDTLLHAEDVKKHFPVNTGLLARLFQRGEREMVKAVDGVSFEINRGESFGLAGESGCGKTTLGESLVRLYDLTDGRIYFDGKEITDISGRELNEFRREAQIVDQDPYQSLNPRFTVYRWVREPLNIHDIGDQEERDAKVYEALELAGLKPVEMFVDKYPHELSGGERQRVGIARALVLEPSFIVADEPASMLDVSIRASVLEVFRRLQRELGVTILYISHDLALLKQMCDRLGIMYLGELVEKGTADDVINNPKHPYTRALVSSVPRVNTSEEREQVKLIGEVPDPSDVPSGCRFHPRCPEIVQPEGYDFEQETWRKVANLRSQILQDNLDIPEGPPKGVTKIKKEFDIPNTLEDETADQLLEGALTSYINGDVLTAQSDLRTEFSTPCEEELIPEYNIEDGRLAKCIKYQPDQD